MERKLIFDKAIPPASGFSFNVKQGQILRVIDIDGKQAGDLVLLNEHNLKEYLDPTYTRTRNRFGQSPRFFIAAPGTRITTGAKLVSNIQREMMTIIADTQVPGGVHDFSIGRCSSWLYDKYGVGPREGCLELLAKALKITPEEVPPNMNVFMNVLIDPVTLMCYIEEPVTRPGDYVEFMAGMDCLAALTACPENVLNKCNGTPPHPQKPLQIQIYELK